MELIITKEEKDTIEFGITGQGHTICNLLREELAKSEEVTVAAYNIKHPQAARALFTVVVNKGKPRKAIEGAAGITRAKIKEMKNLLKKL